MKLFIKLLFFVIAQRFFLDSIFAQQLESGGNSSDDNSAVLGEHFGDFGNALFDAQLLADSSTLKSNVGEDLQNGNVHFTGPGKINLTVPNGLSFRLCPECKNKFIVCYESSSPKSNLHGACSSSQCQLFIDGSDDKFISFGKDISAYIKDKGATCENISINGRLAVFKTVDDIPTCVPKFENGMIQLEIKKADPGCRVEAVGSKIKFPEIITTSKPPTSPKPPSSTPAPPKPDSTSESSFPVWAIIVIVLCLLAIIGVGIFVFCWCKKRQSSKSPVSSAFEPPIAVVTRNDAKESTVSTQAPPPSKQGPKVEKAEPTPSQEPVKKTVEKDAPTLSKEPIKKPHVENKANEKETSTKPEKKVAEKKKTTIEPTTTEEFVAPPALQKPAPYNYPPPHVVPRSYPGSHRTSSVEDAIERNKLTPVESVADSLARNCLKPGDAAIVGKMKKNYPEVLRVRWRHEIVLFCIAISEMFQTLIDMAAEYEDILLKLGVVFDAQHRIVSMTAEARQYLQNPSNPGTCMLFAFGAEYHQYVTDDMKILHKFSIPHLMAVALQPRFPDYHRRKACTWLRRELPKVRENYSIAERKAMPFPISIIEEAFILDPKYLLDTAGLDTDSEADRRKMDEAQKEWLKKKNERRAKGADGKRKKKSSKKRQ